MLVKLLASPLLTSPLIIELFSTNANAKVFM